VAAPLLVLAHPSAPVLAALPAALRRGLGTLLRPASFVLRPGVAFAVHGAAIWIGHAPAVIQWTLESRAAHFVEHAALLGSALLFWRAVVGAPSRYGEALLWTLATMLHTGALGALLAFAPRLLYPGYALEDQQLAGLLMWVPGGFVYVAAAVTLSAAWLKAIELRQAAHARR
jgi:putative membrane protein